MSSSINVEIKDSTALMTIDDGKVNAMNFSFFDQFDQSLDMVEKSDSRGLIIKGRQGFFSAGLDIKLMPTLKPEKLTDLVTRFAQSVLRVYGFPIPTIAACTGHAIAGGAILALACDKRYFLQGSYSFQLNEILIGIPFPSWMLRISKASIPVEHLTDAIMYAKSYTPEEAMECRMIEGIIPSQEDPEKYCLDRAKLFSGLNTRAYALSKKRLRERDIKDSLALLKKELKENIT